MPAVAAVNARAPGSRSRSSNHPSQVVLSGADPGSVNRIVEHFSATSARTLVLPIGGPFHTSAMGWAAIQYEQFAREIPTKPPTEAHGVQLRRRDGSPGSTDDRCGETPRAKPRRSSGLARHGPASPIRASPPASTADPATRSFGSQNVRG